jgi:hypothetical protein
VNTERSGSQNERLGSVQATDLGFTFITGLKEIPKKLKLRLKKTAIDKASTCASETWILTKRD